MSDQAMLERLFCDAFGFDEVSISQRQSIRDAQHLSSYPVEVVVAGLLSGAKVPQRAGTAPEYVEEESPAVEAEVEVPVVETEVEADATVIADEDAVEQPADDVLITDSAIPTKWHDELDAAGLTTVSEVRAVEDLTTIAGIGAKGAEEIQAAIA